jgi:hypothetical protein
LTSLFTSNNDEEPAELLLIEKEGRSDSFTEGKSASEGESESEVSLDQAFSRVFTDRYR